MSRVVAVVGLVLMGGGTLLLSGLSAWAGYVTGLLPGLLVIGAGTGLAFPAATIAAMSDVGAGQEGLASGLMTTAHEIGAELGVAVFSVVAAAQAAAGGGFAAGYRHGFTVAAGFAAGLALVAVVAIPAVRPAPGVRTGRPGGRPAGPGAGADARRVLAAGGPLRRDGPSRRRSR